MAFKLRLLNTQCYLELVKELEWVIKGNSDTLESMLEYCTTTLQSEEFLKWNGLSHWLIDIWIEQLTKVSNEASIATVSSIGPIVVALRCMPLFQFSYLSGLDISPNLIMLGEDDGGLYGILLNSDEWFDTFFLNRFTKAEEPFSVGENMFFMNDGELRNFYKVAQGADIPDESNAPGFAQPLCSQTRRRLVNLIQVCLEGSNLTICVSSD